MGWLGGMLQGFTDTSDQIRQRNQAEDDANRQRENSVFQALLSSPDPEVKNLAIAGVLHSGDPRQKASGLSGWIGKMRSSPYMGMIQQLSPEVPGEAPPAAGGTGTGPAGGQAPTGTPGSGALPSEPGKAAEPPSLAQPATSPTEVGAPPPTATVPLPGAGTPLQPPTGTAGPSASPTLPASVTQSKTQPRQYFETPEDAARKKASATQEGDIGGRVKARVAAGASPQAAVAPELMGARGGLGISHVMVEDQQGVQHAAIFDARRQQYIDPDTQQPILGARPLTSTGSTSLGADRESISRELYNGRRATQLTGPEMAHVNAEVQRRQGMLKPSAALASANTMLPNASVQQKTELADALMAGTYQPPAQGAAAPATAAPTADVGAPPPSIAAPTTAPAPTGAAGPPPAPGARPKLGAAVPPDLATATRETGKPLPPAIAATLAKAQSTNDLIDQALKALEPYKNDNTMEGSVNLARKYKAGYDSVSTAAAQLADLAGLQSSASAQLTAGGSRAQRFYIDRRQHVPRLPSTRQIDASEMIGAGTANRASQWIKGDEGGFDTPALMYKKLQGARDNNQHFIDETNKATTQTKSGGAGTPPPQPMASHGPAAPAAAAGPGPEWQMINGKLYHNGQPY